MKTMTEITHRGRAKDRRSVGRRPSRYTWNYWHSVHEHIHHSWFHSSNPRSLAVQREKGMWNIIRRTAAWHMAANTIFETILISIKLQAKAIFYLFIFFPPFGNLTRLLGGSSSAENKLVKWWLDSTVISIYGGKLVDSFLPSLPTAAWLNSFLPDKFHQHILGIKKKG